MVSLKDLAGKNSPTPEVVNRAFDLFVHALNNKISKIHRVRHLFYPGTLEQFKRFGYDQSQFEQELSGLQLHDRIYISGTCSKTTAIRALIHELSHFLFDMSDERKWERAVLKIEHRLFRKFSDAQKEILWSYVPRKCTLENVDKEPK